MLQMKIQPIPNETVEVSAFGMEYLFLRFFACC